MSTRQAVWPAELTRRRSQALDLERRIRSAQSAATSVDATPVHQQLEALLSALAELPCPHWDVETVDNGQGAWGCIKCHDVITPMWVAIADQEQALRRAAHQHRLHRAG